MPFGWATARNMPSMDITPNYHLATPLFYHHSAPNLFLHRSLTRKSVCVEQNQFINKHILREINHGKIALKLISIIDVMDDILDDIMIIPRTSTIE